MDTQPKHVMARSPRWVDSGKSKRSQHHTACQSHNQSLMKALTLRDQTVLLRVSLGQNKIIIYTSSVFCFGQPKRLLPEALSQCFLSLGDGKQGKMKVAGRGGEHWHMCLGPMHFLWMEQNAAARCFLGTRCLLFRAGLCQTLFPDVCYPALTCLRHRQCLSQ